MTNLLKPNLKWHPKNRFQQFSTIAFILVFASIGAYILFHSFAAPPPKPWKNDDVTSAQLATDQLMAMGRGIHFHPEQKSAAATTLKPISLKRKAILLKLIKSDPGQVPQFLLTDEMLRDLGSVPGNALEKKVTLMGQFQAFHHDQPGGPDFFDYQLVQKSGILHLYTNGRIPQTKSGAKISVTGYQIDDLVFMAASSDTALAPMATIAASTFTPTPLGTLNAAVIVANFANNTTPLDMNAIKAVFQGSPGQDVDSWYSEASYGKSTLAPSFFGPYTLSESVGPGNSCPSGNLPDSELLNLAKNDINFPQFGRYIFEYNCGGAAVGTVGEVNLSTPGGTVTAGVSYDNGSSATERHTVAHELSHNLGNWHTGFFACEPSSFIAPDRFDEGCISGEYGNYFDTLAAETGVNSINTLPHLDVFHKNNAGWFGSNNYLSLSAPGTYSEKLLPYETSTNGLLALNIQRDAATSFTLEYRQPIGFDAWMASGSSTCPQCNVTSGLMLNFIDQFSGPGGGSDTQLIDMTPNSIFDPNNYVPIKDGLDGALTQGKTFTDPEYGITITVGQVDATGANVQITIPSATCTHHDPTITLTSSSSQTVLPGQTANYTYSVKNNDSAGCQPMRYKYSPPVKMLGSSNSSPNYSESFSARLGPDDFTISPGQSITTTLSITPDSQNTDGTWTLNTWGVGIITANSPATNAVSLPTVTYVSASPADTITPSTPSNLSARALGSSVAQLTWAASTDNTAVAGYKVTRDTLNVWFVPSNSFLDTGTSIATHTYTVQAFDTKGNLSPAVSIPLTMTTVSDTVPPTMPGNLAASATDHSINLSWSPSYDGGTGVAGYNIFLLANGASNYSGYVVPASATSVAMTNLPTNTTFSIFIQAFDGSGNTSYFAGLYPSTKTSTTGVYAITSPHFIISTAHTGTSPPTQPTKLYIQSATASGIHLAWSPSTDDKGVTGYYVYRNSRRIGTATTNSYNDTLFAPGSSTLNYYVVGFDVDGNISSPSLSTSIIGPRTSSDSTLPTVSVSAPTAGQSVSGTFTFTATASDNVAVEQIDFFVDGRVVCETSSSPYNCTWNTISDNQASNGNHEVHAVAYDTSYNAISSVPIQITINNSTTTKPGDINGDTKIDILDLSILATNFGACGKSLNQGDLSGDGCVNILDLSILATNWGT